MSANIVPLRVLKTPERREFEQRDYDYEEFVKLYREIARLRATVRELLALQGEPGDASERVRVPSRRHADAGEDLPPAYRALSAPKRQAVRQMIAWALAMQEQETRSEATKAVQADEASPALSGGDQ